MAALAGEVASGRDRPPQRGAILSIATASERDESHYRDRLSRFEALSHVTVEAMRDKEMVDAS